MTHIPDRHWTEDSTDDYLHGISSGFVRAIEAAMENRVTQGELAERLGVSESRVSQVLNNPGNLTLRKIIEYARALNLNVALVPYEGGNNERGMVQPEIFVQCWATLGKPRTFFEFDSRTVVTDNRYSVIKFDQTYGGIYAFIHALNFPSVSVTTTADLTQPIGRRFPAAIGTTGLPSALPAWVTPQFQKSSYTESSNG